MKPTAKAKIGEINEFKNVSVNPLKHPEQTFELYSVPIFETGRPEILKGAEIGSAKQTVQKGDVLLCKINPRINRVWKVEGYTDYPLIASSEWVAVRSSKYAPDYLKWCLQAPPFRSKLCSEVTGIGGSLTRAQPKRIAEYEIPLPPLAEQERIAAELDAVAATLKKRQTQLAELNALVEARFVELFGDPATNPKGWSTGTIRDIVSEVKYGTSKPATVDGRFNYLRMNNITYDGYLDLSDLKKIDVPEAEVEKYIVRQNDVLFNRTNSKELVGKTCVFDADEPMIIAGYIIRVRVNEKATPLFLSRFLNSRYGKTTLFNMCKAIVGQANINAQELQKIAIFIPPLELQERFAAEVERVEALKTTVRAGIAETRTLFDALTLRYFG